MKLVTSCTMSRYSKQTPLAFLGKTTIPEDLQVKFLRDMDWATNQVTAEESEVWTLEANFSNSLAFLAFLLVTLSSNLAASSKESKFFYDSNGGCGRLEQPKVIRRSEFSLEDLNLLLHEINGTDETFKLHAQ